MDQGYHLVQDEGLVAQVHNEEIPPDALLHREELTAALRKEGHIVGVASENMYGNTYGQITQQAKGGEYYAVPSVNDVDDQARARAGGRAW